MRKLTKREKISLGLLLILGFSYLYVQFLILPQNRKMSEVQAERDTVEVEVQKVKNYKTSIAKINDELARDSERLDEALGRNFTKLDQEDIIMLVDGLARDSGLVTQGVSFDRPLEEEVEGQPLELNTAELSFQGGYQTLTDFLDRLSMFKKRIMIDRIAVDSDSDDLLTGTVYMKMYSLENVVEDTESLFDWNRDESYFASNPFSPFSSYIEAMRREEAANQTSSNDDSSTLSTGNTPNYYSPSGNTNTSSGTSSISGGTSSSGTSSGSSSASGGTSGGSNSSSGGGSSSGGTKDPSKPSEPSKPSKPAKPAEKKTVVESFENEKDFFLVGSPREDVTGSVSNSADKTEKKSSINLKYNFLKERRYSSINIGFVDELFVKNEQSRVSVDIKPLMNNPHVFRLVMKDSRGKYYDLKLSDGFNWSGWKTLSADVPSDAEFPVSLERMYIESKDYEKVLLGDILLDNLQVIE